MPKTVAYFVDTNEFSGAERALLQLLKGLDRNVWNPVLILHKTPGLAPLVEAAAGLGIDVRTVPRMQGRQSFLPRLRQGLDAITGFGPFVRELSSIRPDVFHAHQNWPMACKYALIGAAVARVPRVLATVHLFPEMPHVRWSAWQHRLITAAVNAYIAVSKEVARCLSDVLHVPAAKIAVIPNAASPRSGEVHTGQSRAAFLAPGTTLLALTPARLSLEKGHRFLLVAAARLPKVTFLLAGEGPERKALEQQARALNLGPHVKFLGYREDVPELLDICDLLVLPSLCEGLPLSVLEAMAAAKPVIATALPGTAEAVVHGGTGLLVPPADPIALSDAIQKVAGDEGLLRAFGLAGADRARRDFSVTSMVSSVTAMYQV